MNKQTPAELAISKARAALILDHAFFGSLALRLQPIASDRTKTMATDGHSLFFNGPWVESLKPAEMCGLIAHEVMHLTMAHHCRRGHRDPRKWNVACLAWGTPILFADGTERPIQRVMPGDVIASPIGGSRVIAVIFNGWKPAMLMEFGNRSVICTDEHIFGTNEGWYNAAEIGHAGCNGYTLRQPERSGIYFGKPLPPIVDRNEQRNGSGVCESVGVSEKARTLSEQVFFQATEFTNPQYNDRLRNSIFRGFGGRRGDYLCSKIGSRILASVSTDRQHLLPAYALAENARFFGVNADEQFRQLVLSDRGFWTSDRHHSSEIAAVAYHQAVARARITASYGEPEESALSSAHRNEFYRGGNARNYPAIEQARGALAARARECLPVFELVTEAGSYFAAGILTHNCDFAINPLLVDAGFTLPAGGLLNPAYRGLAAEQIYARLPADQGGGKGPSGASGEAGDAEPAPGEVWDAPAEDGAPAPSDATLAAEEANWKAAVLQAAQSAKAAGNCPGFARDLAAKIRAPKVDWRDQLRRYMTATQRNDYSWARPNVRHLAAGDWFPSLHSETIGEVLVAIDTSGSISAGELSAFLAELNGIADEARPERLHVVYCHAAVYQADEIVADDYPITLHDMQSGGTAFAPVWEWAKNSGVAPVCAVYLTDLDCGSGGFGADPGFPVLWLSTLKDAAPFGEVVRLEVEG